MAVCALPALLTGLSVKSTKESVPDNFSHSVASFADAATQHLCWSTTRRTHPPAISPYGDGGRSARQPSRRDVAWSVNRVVAWASPLSVAATPRAGLLANTIVGVVRCHKTKKVAMSLHCWRSA